MFSLGIDLGSTTVKFVLLNDEGALVERRYERHRSDVVGTLTRSLESFCAKDDPLSVVFSGSGALGIAQALQAPFLQEVVADQFYLKRVAPNTDVAVELGGEDAKLLYLTNGVELRMNEACAGGTGAFIDQMAQLLNTDAAGLNELASRADASRSIASRCGVFAKTDVVSLLNSGVSREIVARSVFDAVAEQTISGLACGRTLAGNIAFLGGPLAFLSQLRSAFVRQIGTEKASFLDLRDAQYAVATGAAQFARQKKTSRFQSAKAFFQSLKNCRVSQSVSALTPLFASETEREAFRCRHQRESMQSIPISDARGPLFLGVDLGSTTIKGVLIDSVGRIAFRWYENNEGHPLERLYSQMRTLLSALPEKAFIQSACTTGYGADLARAALSAPFSEVETIAHLKAATAFDPQVSYVIDIGGQDMKCMAVQSGCITSVKLNEACSSGCGSFLQTFAAQLGLSLSDFVAAAERAQHPSDLGTRCTVFMTSMVRQAQRAGISLEDIAAGLCRSVVRNALYKVLRVSQADELGGHVVVQGGTFLNDAVLRSFELETGLSVIRPSIAGLMGAYGAALIAKERHPDKGAALKLVSEALSLKEIVRRDFRCQGCSNRCLLQINRFASGEKYVSGNRCDFALKSAGAKKKADEGFMEKKRRLLFDRPVVNPNLPSSGIIGIPRVLNMYEHYPYWNALFVSLGFTVQLSDLIAKSSLLQASGTIPSQSLCFPAKLAHAHAVQLATEGVKTIWLPCVPYEGKPFEEADGRFACPVVAGYPEALRLNMQSLYPQVRILTPFLDLERDETVERSLKEAFPQLETARIREALSVAKKALNDYRDKLRKLGQDILQEHRITKKTLVILAGHPYHADPLISNGIPSLIESMGVDIVSEDAVCGWTEATDKTDAVNQWTFHSRLYRAAKLAASNGNIELVHLVSFGCGLDAITSEEVSRILQKAGKLYTQLKIDESDTLGAAKIRLRSLLAALKEKERHTSAAALVTKEVPIHFVPRGQASKEQNRVDSVARKRSGHTLYAPQMAPIHFPLITGVLNELGWSVKLLKEARPEAFQLGLKHVNNDACYPAIVVIGQLLDAVLNDPDFDREKDAVLLAQTCGPCRASNYPTLMRWALRDVGCENVPVVCLAAGQLGSETLKPGFFGTRRLMTAVICGDMLQRLSLYVRAHEKRAGDAERLLSLWQKRLSHSLPSGKRQLRALFSEMVKSFMEIPMDSMKKPSVGIVGEILLKYHPQANRAIVERILSEGAVPVLGDLALFFHYCLSDYVWQAQKMGGSKLKGMLCQGLLQYFEGFRAVFREALQTTPVADVVSTSELLGGLHGLVSPGQQAGEGWLLTAEMVEFLKRGIPNILCLQPFGCLPNHVTGKGVIRTLRQTYPQANLCAIDFEPATPQANIDNRLKLFLAQAFENVASV